MGLCERSIGGVKSGTESYLHLGTVLVNNVFNRLFTIGANDDTFPGCKADMNNNMLSERGFQKLRL